MLDYFDRRYQGESTRSHLPHKIRILDISVDELRESAAAEIFGDEIDSPQLSKSAAVQCLKPGAGSAAQVEHRIRGGQPEAFRHGKQAFVQVGGGRERQ